jgi:hypothetical protein
MCLTAATSSERFLRNKIVAHYTILNILILILAGCGPTAEQRVQMGLTPVPVGTAEHGASSVTSGAG